jgi:hypothetical protein
MLSMPFLQDAKPPNAVLIPVSPDQAPFERRQSAVKVVALTWMHRHDSL